MSSKFCIYCIVICTAIYFFIVTYFLGGNYLWIVPKNITYLEAQGKRSNTKFSPQKSGALSKRFTNNKKQLIEEDFITQLNGPNEEYEQIANRIYDTKNLHNGSCILPNIDPWDPAVKKKFPDLTNPKVRKYLREVQDDSVIVNNFWSLGYSLETCTPTFNQITWLENGLLEVDDSKNVCPSDPECYFKCLHPINETKMKEDEWKLIDDAGVRPNCDIVETKCPNCSNYEYIHTQIVEKKTPISTNTSNVPKFNFYWIIVDSTSHLTTKRTMHKTLDYLLNKMDAIEFPHLSKIGANSLQNSHGMFFGEESPGLKGFYFRKDNISTEEIKPDAQDLCHKYLDTFNFVGFDFKNAGYQTMMTEDSVTGVLSYTGCTGFKNPPVDHFTRPFWLKVGGGSPSEYTKDSVKAQMYGPCCKITSDYILEQTLQFADSYSNTSKFSISWLSERIHGDNTVLFGFDRKFTNFFEELDKKSEDSFIFFQADHGFKWGAVHEIPAIGMIEDNNPFFYVVAPKMLRKNPSFMSQIKENSKHLVTHFDIYASAVQVAKFSANWTAQTQFNRNPEPIPGRNFIGSSIFHQMKQPRDCKNLHIPLDYCNCYVKRTSVNDSILAERVAQFIIDFLNYRLNQSRYKDLCSTHTLDPEFPITLEEFVSDNKNGTTFMAKFQTLPGHALYQAKVELGNDGLFTLKKYFIPRLNAYKGQVECIPHDFIQNYCVCNSLVQYSNVTTVL